MVCRSPLRENAFDYFVIDCCTGIDINNNTVGLGIVFVMEVQLSQLPAGFDKTPEIGTVFHQRQTRQHFFEIGCKRFPILRAVQYAIYIVEHVFLLGHVAILTACPLKNEIADAVATRVPVLIRFGQSIKQRGIVLLTFFVPIKRKTLIFINNL